MGRPIKPTVLYLNLDHILKLFSYRFIMPNYEKVRKRCVNLKENEKKILGRVKLQASWDRRHFNHRRTIKAHNYPRKKLVHRRFAFPYLLTLVQCYTSVMDKIGQLNKVGVAKPFIIGRETFKVRTGRGCAKPKKILLTRVVDRAEQ